MGLLLFYVAPLRAKSESARAATGDGCKYPASASGSLTLTKARVAPNDAIACTSDAVGSADLTAKSEAIKSGSMTEAAVPDPAIDMAPLPPKTLLPAAAVLVLAAAVGPGSAEDDVAPAI